MAIASCLTFELGNPSYAQLPGCAYSACALRRITTAHGLGHTWAIAIYGSLSPSV
jgi:hypothetical protein